MRCVLLKSYPTELVFYPGLLSLSGAVKAVICGLGPYGYVVALQAAAHMLGALPESFPKPLRALGGPAKAR